MIAPVRRFEPTAGRLFASYQGTVVQVDDPEGSGRVRVRLLSFDGHPDQDAEVWARVAVPFAGADSGSFMIPDVGDEVVVTLLNGDPRLPVVVGSLWNGEHSPPETLGGDGSRVDRWTLVGKAGTRIAIVEEESGQAHIHLATPDGGPEITIDQGGTITISAGSTITVEGSKVKIETSGKLEATASQIKLEAGLVDVSAGMAKFSGVVKCETLITNSVVSSSYTPGAGNIW